MESGTERRGLLRLFAFVFGGLCGGAGFASVFDPLRKRDERWIPLAPVDKIAPGQATRVRYTVTAGWEQTERSVYLVRSGDDVLALDARCTHLGCNVRYRDGEFHCPCHQGAFDGEGQPISGPVSKPLERMETRVQGGMIEGKA